MLDRERDTAYWTRCAAAILRRIVSIVYGIISVSHAVRLSAMETLWPLVREHEPPVVEMEKAKIVKPVGRVEKVRLFA